MRLARVVATVVSTITSPIFEDRTLLVCDVVDPSGDASGGYMIAVDTVGAGAGELVLVLDEGTSARQIVGATHGPLRAVVVGIVDAVEGPAAGANGAGGENGAAPQVTVHSKTDAPPKAGAKRKAGARARGARPGHGA